MIDEYFRIFDEKRNEIGVASRSEVHKFGYWHETFHCWFVTKFNDTDYIYLQLRSETKKDYPNLLDITAAGHLTSDETVRDGVREIKEEVGIEISFDELEELGVIEYCETKENFIDKELAHVFLYKSEYTLDNFVVQTEEVAGMFLAEFKDFRELWLGERDIIRVNGFKIDEEGNKEMHEVFVGKDKFVPHQHSFYEKVIEKIEEKI